MELNGNLILFELLVVFTKVKAVKKFYNLSRLTTFEASKWLIYLKNYILCKQSQSIEIKFLYSIKEGISLKYDV